MKEQELIKFLIRNFRYPPHLFQLFASTGLLRRETQKKSQKWGGGTPLNNHATLSHAGLSWAGKGERSLLRKFGESGEPGVFSGPRENTNKGAKRCFHLHYWAGGPQDGEGGGDEKSCYAARARLCIIT
jgi:hypothetical protein